MPSIDYKRVRELVSMAQMLKLIDFVAVERKGTQLRGPCPVHKSSSAASRNFSVNLEKNTYRCFSCGSQGNQLDLYVAVTKSPLHEAAVDLCRQLGIDVPRREQADQAADTARTRQTEKRNP